MKLTFCGLRPSSYSGDRVFIALLCFDDSIECGIFGEESQISTGQKREKSAFSILIGCNL